jgi:hypothetical protein
VALALAACGTSDDRVDVSLAPTVLFPRGILDQVTKLTLRAYGPSATCDADTGIVGGDIGNPLIEQELGSDGCAEGARFCGDIAVRRSSTPYTFSAAADDDSGKRLANGCAIALVDEPRVPLAIQMRRFLEPVNCGDGTLEPTELCDPPNQPDTTVCDASCKTLEVRLSKGSGTPGGTADGKPGDKAGPLAVWPGGTGTNAKFLALFTDKTPATREVTMSVRSDAFGRFTSMGADVADNSFFMPHTPGASFPPTEQPNNQSAPAAVGISGHTWIAFEDDEDGNVDIRLRSIDATLTAEQLSGALRVNGTVSTGEAGDQTLPAIAATSKGILFIAWQDDRDGSIQGRTYNPSDNTRGATRTLSTGASNSNVRVASRGTGFVAVWENGTDIKLAVLSPDGTPEGEQKVNGSARTGPVSHPDVAVLADGRFAVAFSDRGDVFVQRYGTDGKQLAGDQDNRINAIVADGDQRAPVIAAMPAAGGSYAVAWLDGASGDVRAAYLGGSAGFLFNPIDAEAGEFAASAVPGRRRANPAIAVGGSGPFVAVVWEDTSSDAKAGIYGRRLPLPLP